MHQVKLKITKRPVSSQGRFKSDEFQFESISVSSKKKDLITGPFPSFTNYKLTSAGYTIIGIVERATDLVFNNIRINNC